MSDFSFRFHVDPIDILSSLAFSLSEQHKNHGFYFSLISTHEYEEDTVVHGSNNAIIKQAMEDFCNQDDGSYLDNICGETEIINNVKYTPFQFSTHCTSYLFGSPLIFTDPKFQVIIDAATEHLEKAYRIINRMPRNSYGLTDV